MKQPIFHKGMTLIEMLVTISIFTIIMIAVSTFARNVIVYNRSSFNNLTGAQNSQVILKVMARELRSASPGNNGSYPIVQAATSSITFFADTDDDGLKEQIRYFLTGLTLKKGSIKPSGSPLSYSSGSEVLTTLADNLKNGTSTSLFEYYNDTYDGTSGSTPLSQPVTVTAISLVKVNLLIGLDPNDPIAPILYSSQITLRNLKDNS